MSLEINPDPDWGYDFKIVDRYKNCFMVVYEGKVLGFDETFTLKEINSWLEVYWTNGTQNYQFYRDGKIHYKL